LLSNFNLRRYDVDARSAFGDVTALHTASWRGDPAIVDALLDAGAGAYTRPLSGSA